MRYANTAKSAITLNIASTGNKPIYINGKASSADNYSLPAGSFLVYYDGTNYQFRTDGLLPGPGSATSASAIAGNKALIDKKADDSVVQAHITNNNIHVTEEQKEDWSSKAPGTHPGVIATDSVLGHVKLSDSTASDLSVSGGVAATPKAVKEAYTLATSVKTDLATNYTKTSTLSSTYATKAYADQSETDAVASAKTYTDKAIADVIGAAPDNLNTLKELADVLTTQSGDIGAINTALAGKANSSDLTAHTGNTTIHITATERTK